VAERKRALFDIKNKGGVFFFFFFFFFCQRAVKLVNLE